MPSRYPVNMRWIIPLCIAAFVFVDVDTGCACSPKVINYLTSMKSDLWTLADWQERYRSEHGRYASQLTALTIENRYGDTVPYEASEGVVVVLERGDERGWIARARHEQLTITCTMGAGQGAPVGPRVDLRYGGAMVCDPLGGDPYRTVATARLAAVSLAIVLVATLVGLRLARRQSAPRRPVTFLFALIILHPMWFALVTLALKTHSPDCGLTNNLIAISFAVLAGILLFAQWLVGRSRRLAA